MSRDIGRSRPMWVREWLVTNCHSATVRLLKKRRGLRGGLCAALVTGAALLPLSSISAAADNSAALAGLAARTSLENVTNPDDEGRRIRLIYYAPVPVESFWNFKTDFQNEWLVSNQYIAAHRFISRHGNVVLTETKYTYGPDIFFRWQTVLYPESRTLRYTLLNPAECGQAFNYGVITLEPDGDLTRVTHTSHFDFAGALLWAHLPGPWGMVDFFHYTARWEQETILRLQSRYTDEPARNNRRP